MKKIAIICCSNAQMYEWQHQNEELADFLASVGRETVFSKFLYATDGLQSASAAERAEEIIDFYKDNSVEMICDVSGGDIANDVIDYLDFDVIANNPKPLWGYSDLTSVLNAVYTKTGNKAVLYQIKNLVYDRAEEQREAFVDTYINDGVSLYQFPYEFVQGECMEGVVVGGNIRCLLKLAGTEYFPDMTGKLLLLEAYGGETAQMIAYLSQLRQMGVFDKINGIILGTFTRMETQNIKPTIDELVCEYIKPNLPVIKTGKIGHGSDSKGIVIGEYRKF